ncbi:MAG: hypothetical protein AB2L14_28905 [Candidatus Xenobiia bacterium LiM19]
MDRAAYADTTMAGHDSVNEHESDSHEIKTASQQIDGFKSNEEFPGTPYEVQPDGSLKPRKWLVKFAKDLARSNQEIKAQSLSTNIFTGGFLVSTGALLSLLASSLAGGPILASSLALMALPVSAPLSHVAEKLYLSVSEKYLLPRYEKQELERLIEHYNDIL